MKKLFNNLLLKLLILGSAFMVFYLPITEKPGAWLFMGFLITNFIIWIILGAIAAYMVSQINEIVDGMKELETKEEIEEATGLIKILLHKMKLDTKR